MNLFRNESHSGEMKTVPKAESEAAPTVHGSSLKLELYERINENIQTTIKITICNKHDELLFSLCVLLSVHF